MSEKSEIGGGWEDERLLLISRKIDVLSADPGAAYMGGIEREAKHSLHLKFRVINSNLRTPHTRSVYRKRWLIFRSSRFVHSPNFCL